MVTEVSESLQQGMTIMEDTVVALTEGLGSKKAVIAEKIGKS